MKAAPITSGWTTNLQKPWRGSGSRLLLPSRISWWREHSPRLSLVLGVPLNPRPFCGQVSIMHTLRERSRKVERRKGQRYGSEFRRQAVERMTACGNIVGLARELGVSRRVLYQWRDRMEQTDSSPGRSRELILRKQIVKLKRLLANKTLEVDFFRHALQRVGARRRRDFRPGDKASMTK